jgi:hypothetical protein
MWQKEGIDEAPSKSPCCGNATVKNPKKGKESPEVNFNLWTGEQRRDQVQVENNIQCWPCSSLIQDFCCKAQNLLKKSLEVK